MARTGRPQKPYQPSWGGDPIIGLYRRKDGRCEFVISFAKTEGEDSAQIDAALSRMAVLKAPKDDRAQ